MSYKVQWTSKFSLYGMKTSGNKKTNVVKLRNNDTLWDSKPPSSKKRNGVKLRILGAKTPLIEKSGGVFFLEIWSFFGILKTGLLDLT